MKNKESRRSQTIKKMMEEFHQCWLNGMNIYEVAEKFSISFSSVYRNLGEIAKANGMSREDYLKRPHKTHVTTQTCTNHSNQKITDEEVYEIAASYNQVISQMRMVEKEIDKILNENENFMNQMEEKKV